MTSSEPTGKKKRSIVTATPHTSHLHNRSREMESFLARRLGIGLNTLRRKLARYGIS